MGPVPQRHRQLSQLPLAHSSTTFRAQGRKRTKEGESGLVQSGGMAAAAAQAFAKDSKVRGRGRQRRVMWVLGTGSHPVCLGPLAQPWLLSPPPPLPQAAPLEDFYRFQQREKRRSGECTAPCLCVPAYCSPTPGQPVAHAHPTHPTLTATQHAAGNPHGPRSQSWWTCGSNSRQTRAASVNSGRRATLNRSSCGAVLGGIPSYLVRCTF